MQAQSNPPPPASPVPRDNDLARKPYVVLVGIDYSEISDHALQRAFETALGKPDADVHIVHVLPLARAISPVELGEVASVPDTQTLQSASQVLRDYAERQLQSFIRTLPRNTQLFHRAVSHVRFSAPAHEISQLAGDLQADLVVVGTHGRRGAARWLLGSVAEQVVRLAPCPVLVVRQKQQEDNGPQIEPPCPYCLQARFESRGQELWCATHRERHLVPHHYHYADRVASDTHIPMFIPQH